MNAKKLDKIVDKWLDIEQNNLKNKSVQYSTDNDRLANFKQAAELQGCTPEEALFGFVSKHIVALADYVKDPGGTPRPWFDEKIMDIRAYMILLDALLEERDQLSEKDILALVGEGVLDDVLNAGKPKPTISIYMSHPIRGINRDAVAKTEIEKNNKIAIKFAKKLREAVKDKPYEVDLYVPAEKDEVPAILYLAGKLSEEDLLWADCKIIDRCDIVIMYNHQGTYSKGMVVENRHAKEKMKSIYMVGPNYSMPGMVSLIEKEMNV